MNFRRIASMESLTSTAYLQQATFSIHARVLEIQRTKSGCFNAYLGPLYYGPPATVRPGMEAPCIGVKVPYRRRYRPLTVSGGQKWRAQIFEVPHIYPSPCRRAPQEGLPTVCTSSLPYQCLICFFCSRLTSVKLTTTTYTDVGHARPPSSAPNPLNRCKPP